MHYGTCNVCMCIDAINSIVKCSFLTVHMRSYFFGIFVLSYNIIEIFWDFFEIF